MNILFTGSVDGEILDFYMKVLDLEKQQNIYIDWIFAVGDFGIWPDPKEVDKATRARKKTAGDFAYLYLDNWEAPRQTLFIAGVHEDHDFLTKKCSQGNLELLPNVTLLANGSRTVLNSELKIAGVGKSYSPAVFFEGKISNRSYTQRDIRNVSAETTDILLTYEAPKGKSIKKFKSIAEGIRDACLKAKPQLLVHSTPATGIHQYISDEGIRVLALGRREVMLATYENHRISLNNEIITKEKRNY